LNFTIFKASQNKGMDRRGYSLVTPELLVMNGQVENTPSKFLLVSILFLLCGSILACTSPPTPKATPIVTSEKAIEIAIGDCKIPHLVLVGEPKNIHTKLLTLEEADKQTRVEGETTNYGIPMDTLVWLVQMDGQLQLVGGPPTEITEDSRVATPTPPQPFWGTCSVILDANSGELISVIG
jgi:hypothetical protein